MPGRDPSALLAPITWHKPCFRDLARLVGLEIAELKLSKAAGAAMDRQASVIFECPFDEQTIKTFQDLRTMRLSIARQQYGDVARTVAKLVDRNLLEEGDRQTYA